MITPIFTLGKIYQTHMVEEVDLEAYYKEILKDSEHGNEGEREVYGLNDVGDGEDVDDEVGHGRRDG